MDKQTRQSLARRVAQRSGLSQRQAYKLVGEVLWAMGEVLGAGAVLELRSFGVFEPVERPGRKIQVPSRGVVKVPKRKNIRFRASAKLQQRLNQVKGRRAASRK